MKCDKVQEFLFTDYIDGLINKETAASIDEHITGCAKCREVKEAVTATRTSLKSAKRQEAPSHIWYRVKEEILYKEKEEKRGLGWVPSILKDIFTAPRYVFARATTVALIILILVFAGFAVQRHSMTRQVSDQDIFGLASFDTNGDEALSGFDTPVEKYFL